MHRKHAHSRARSLYALLEEGKGQFDGRANIADLKQEMHAPARWLGLLLQG